MYKNILNVTNSKRKYKSIHFKALIGRDAQNSQYSISGEIVELSSYLSGTFTGTMFLYGSLLIYILQF